MEKYQYHIFGPYRVCTLGAHVDHQHGLVTGFVIDKGVDLFFDIREGSNVVLDSETFSGHVEFDIAMPSLVKQGDWGDYARGAKFALQKRFKLLKGITGTIKGSIPVGGLSSSAAVLIAYVMAFAKANGIQIFNYGNCRRDFTYVDDIVEGVYRVMQGAPERKKGEDGLPIPPYAVYNIGGGQPENLLNFVQILQEELVRAGVLPADFDFEGHKELVAMQPGDVPTTYADATALERDFGFTPPNHIKRGPESFCPMV